MFRLWLQLFLNLRNFPIFFENDCQKTFLLENLGFLSQKLGTNDYLPMTKAVSVAVLALALV